MREKDFLVDKESEPSLGGAGTVCSLSLSSASSLLCGNGCAFYLGTEGKRCAIGGRSVLWC